MRYPGGKGGCFRHLINLMPPHEVYIETHLGGGNVLERKKPAARNIGIDIDPAVIRAWRREKRQGWLSSLELHQMDAADFLSLYWFTGRELVYCDPPYLHSTRSDPAIYRYEYTEGQHVVLLDILVSLPCAVMVSGYESELYRETLERRHSWRCLQFPSMTRGGLRTECVWFNFEPPAVLHDASYAGDNYRERERIKRKRNRWRRRFEAMSAGERQVVWEALLELAPPKPAMDASPAENGRAGSRRTNDLDPPRYLSTPEKPTGEAI